MSTTFNNSNACTGCQYFQEKKNHVFVKSFPHYLMSTHIRKAALFLESKHSHEDIINVTKVYLNKKTTSLIKVEIARDNLFIASPTNSLIVWRYIL